MQRGKSFETSGAADADDRQHGRGVMAATPQSAVRLTLLMCAAESLSMTGFACFTTLLPVLMKAWGLNNSEAGLISGVFYTGYMLAVPVLTSLTDRVDSRRVYLFACALSAVGAGGFAWFANGLWSALVFQFLIGAGLAGTYMPGLKTLTDHLEGKAQPRAQSLPPRPNAVARRWPFILFRDSPQRFSRR